MKIRSLLVSLMAMLSVACTSYITSVETIYPTQLNVPHGDFPVTVGAVYGFAISATVVGKGHVEVTDAITFTIRDPSIVSLAEDPWRAQGPCPYGGGITSVCLQLNVYFQGLKSGSTWIYFKAGGVADSLHLVVANSEKG